MDRDKNLGTENDFHWFGNRVTSQLTPHSSATRFQSYTQNFQKIFSKQKCFEINDLLNAFRTTAYTSVQQYRDIDL